MAESNPDPDSSSRVPPEPPIGGLAVALFSLNVLACFELPPRAQCFPLSGRQAVSSC
jgi:hypothetical protein